MQVVLQVLMLFLLMMCGLMAVKTRLMDDKGISGMNTFVLYFAQPCLIVAKMQQDATPEMMRELVWVFLLSCVVMSVCALIGYILFHRQEPKRRAVLSYLCMAANSGFMGYPVITAALGAENLIYAAVFVMSFNLIAWTLGAALLGGRKAMRPAELISNPSLIAVVIGLTLFLTGWRLPSSLSQIVNMMGDTTTPLAMFIIGARLITMRWDTLKDYPLLTACVMRLIILPALTLLLLRLAGLPNMVVSVVYLCTAMPCATLSAMQAELYHGDYLLAGRGVALSTALSVITIPLMLLLL